MQSYKFEYSKLFTKKNGSAELSDTYLTLHLEEEEKHIPFSEVASYEIQQAYLPAYGQPGSITGKSVKNFLVQE